MLTGKNKEQFEHYLSGVFKPNHSSWSRLSDFYALPLSMQFGVVQDYADSIGYDVCTFFDETYDENDNSQFECFWSASKNGMIGKDGYCKTRDEARKAAIKAFDEIVNSAT